MSWDSDGWREGARDYHHDRLRHEPPGDDIIINGEEPQEITPLPFMRASAWHGNEAPPREWTVLNRVPHGNVTLLSGDGGVGKTVLALHLAVAVASSGDWLGTMPANGPALVLCAEDDIDELHRRVALIAEHIGVPMSELDELHLRSMAGEDALLAWPDNAGIIRPTPLFHRLKKTACSIQPKLIVVDNLADVFGGMENNRAQARQFVTILRGLAMSAGSGLLLTAHPSLTGISTGTGLSGTTGWNASVRSRMYFKRVTAEKDEEPDPDLRVLEIMKANYGPTGETVTVRWHKGLFVPVAGASTIDKIAAEAATDTMFVTLLQRLNDRGENISTKRTANMYGPTVFAKEPEAKAAGIKKKDFVASMSRLFDADRIHLQPYGPPSRDTQKLVPGAKP